MFHMSNDSHLFRTREQLETDGWKLEGNVFRRETEEHLPLYEAKMVHHFDHRWASYRTNGGKEAAIDVSPQDKENPDFTVLPRYWVAAREVRLRAANLPKGLLAALRDHNAGLIVLAVCHLLFINRLRQESEGSADAAVHEVVPTWIEFVEQHPVARSLAPTQMGLCGNSPACIQPLGPSYLPAEPIDKIKTGPRASTAWYVVDPRALAQSFASFEPYGGFLDPAPPLRTGDEAIAFAEKLLSRASPRWLMGWREITNSTNERTLISSTFPFSAVNHKLPMWTTDSEREILLPTLLSSLVCDFAVRFKAGGTNLGFFIAEQVSVLPPSVFNAPVPWGSGETTRDWLLPRAIELTYTAWNLEPFAADCGWDGPPFRWDEDRRFLLRCELDAAFFHLYLPTDGDGDWRPARPSNGCPHDETPEQVAELKRHFPTPRDAIAYILDTFPILRRKDEQQHSEYRTKRTILDIYDAMQASNATDEPYRTPLNPPPADPSRCHPPLTTVHSVLPPAELAELAEWCVVPPRNGPSR